MSKDEYLVSGTVIKVERNLFKVQLDDSDAIVLCTLAAKLKLNRIFVTKADSVEIIISAYDITRGRIVKRL